MTSSYKLDEQPGEASAEIVEWGNDGRKVTHAYRERDGKLAGIPAGGNPFRHAQDVKVGDYVVYKVTEKSKIFAAASGQRTSTSTLTVSDRDEKAAAFEAFYDLSTVDLTKPFDMCTAVATIHTTYGFFPRNEDQFGFQKTGEGKETIKIGNKTYDCTWIEGKVNARVLNKDPRNSYTFTAEMKIWIANDTPAVKQDKEDKIDVRPLKFVPKDIKQIHQIGGKGMLTLLADAAAVEKLVAKEAAKGLIDQVDFDKEKIVFVSWSSGGPPFGTLEHEVQGKGKDRQLVFYVQGPFGPNARGARGEGLRIGADFFACPKWLAVGFERGERKFDPKLFEELLKKAKANEDQKEIKGLIIDVESIRRMEPNEQKKEVERLYRTLAPRIRELCQFSLIEWAFDYTEGRDQLTPQAWVEKVWALRPDAYQYLLWDTQGEGYDILKKQRTELRPLVLADLASKNEKDVKWALHVVSEVSGKEFFEPVLEVFEKNAACSVEAIEALCYIDDPRAIAPLIKRHPELVGVFEALRRLQRERKADPALVALLDAKDAQVRWRAAYGLAESGDPALVGHIEKLVCDDNPQVREAAANMGLCLDKEAYKRVRPAIVALAKDPDPNVKKFVLMCLARRRDAACGPALLEMARAAALRASCWPCSAASSCRCSISSSLGRSARSRFTATRGRN